MACVHALMGMHVNTRKHTNMKQQPLKLLVKMGRWLADWLRRLDSGVFFSPAIFLLVTSQPPDRKGKCKDKLPCVMMGHETKGRMSGTYYICVSCAKKNTALL